MHKNNIKSKSCGRSATKRANDTQNKVNKNVARHEIKILCVTHELNISK